MSMSPSFDIGQEEHHVTMLLYEVDIYQITYLDNALVFCHDIKLGLETRVCKGM